MSLGKALKSVFTEFTFGIDQGKLSAVNRTTGQAVTNLSVSARLAAKLEQRVGGFLSTMARGAAVLAAGFGIKSVTSDVANATLEIDRMSKALGVSTDFFQELQFALDTETAGGQKAAQVLADVSERLFDAAGGSKALRDDFALLGLTQAKMKLAAQEGPEAQFNLLADAMERAGPGAERTFVAMSGLSDTGKDLIPLLQKGSKGFKKIAAEAHRYGVVLDKEAIAQGKMFAERMIVMKARIRGVRNAIANRLIPALNIAIDRFVKWTKKGNGVTVMLTALAAIATVTSVILAAMLRTFILAQWGKFVLILKAAVKWFRALNVQMIIAQLKIAAIAGAVILLAAIIEDLVFFAQGERSLIGRIFGQDEQLLFALRTIEQAFRTIIGELSTAFGELWGSIVMLAGAFNIELTTIGAALKTVGKILFKVVLFALLAIAGVFTIIIRAVSFVISLVARLAAVLVGGVGVAVAELGVFFSNFGESVGDIFDNIELAGLTVANALKVAFEASARFATKAWGKFKTFLGTIKDVVVSLGGRAKNFLLRRTEGVTGGLTTSPGAGVPRAPAAAPVTVNANTTVNANGLDEAAATRVAEAAAAATMRETVNGLVRDLSPPSVGVPSLLPAGT